MYQSHNDTCHGSVERIWKDFLKKLDLDINIKQISTLQESGEEDNMEGIVGFIKSS